MKDPGGIVEEIACPSNESDIDKPKLVTADSLVPKILMYNVTKENHNFKHDLDKKSFIVQKNLQDKLQEISNESENVKTAIELQLEKSEAKLTELLDFGNELVNNIKAYNERQEVMRMQRGARREKELQLSMQEESEMSLKQFDIINSKWENILKLKEPIAIYEQMRKQKEAISELLASKDDMIQRCQEELQQTNKKYILNQINQSSDICFLIERIHNQIELMKKAYRGNIDDLIQTIEIERQKFNNEKENKWTALHVAITTKERSKSQIVTEKQTFYASELQKIWIKQEALTRATKIQMEKDADLLQVEIRKTRANILLNSEKIDYNYQVLQKRNEENIILNNQQKRRVGKLMENISFLKRRLLHIKRINKNITNRLTRDIQKIHGSISEKQLKLEHFRNDNRKKFNKVWDVNFKELKALLCSLMEIDRILYEQQLGMKWEKPDFDVEALDILENMPACSTSVDTFEMAPQFGPRKPLKYNQLYDILMKISDRAGFLVESKLLELMKPYSDQEKCLVRLENIFSALHITDIKMIENLIKYFEPYSYCPNCTNSLPPPSFLQMLYAFKSDTPIQLDKQKKKQAESIDCPDHYLVVEPALVLTALNKFTTKQMKSIGIYGVKKNACKDAESNYLFQMGVTDIESYWNQFLNYLSNEKQNVWKSIEHGLNHYLAILKKRQKMDKECVLLQKQNTELKFLLQKL